MQRRMYQYGKYYTKLKDRRAINKELFYNENSDILSNKPLTANTRKPIMKKNTSTSNKAENESKNNNEIHFPYIISCLKRNDKLFF